MDIHYLKGEEIDKTKWNSCVHYANNGNVFGYMWYLNNVAKEWDALIEGDYESVLPLIWRPQILNTKTIYQPQLVRESGIYSINVLSKSRVKNFLNAVPSEYQNIHFSMNEGIKVPEEVDFQKTPQLNYQLLLNKDYPSIALNYSENFKETISKAESEGLRSVSNLKPEVIADFYKTNTKDKTNKEEKYHALQRIMYNVLHRGLGFASGISNSNGEILSVGFYIFSHGKMVNLVNVTSSEGISRGAHLMLVDRIIQTYAQRPMILDFNSDEKWIEDFGVLKVSYLHVRRKKGWRKFL